MNNTTIVHRVLTAAMLTTWVALTMAAETPPPDAARKALAERRARDAKANALLHAGLVAKADASVAKAVSAAQSDPHYPRYHLRPAAYWNNDPNGPVQFRGQYHVFFQHNPYGEKWGNMSWAHAVSRDLVHWKHLPIALVPTPQTYDKDGIFSGCCVINDGVPTILYTGVSPECQCVATSGDGMVTWKKHEGNPVIPFRPQDDLHGFRDPFVWKESGLWYMLIGSGIKGRGGTALLYRSGDLLDWEYMHPLCVGFGENWECPNFFPLGDKHVLVVSPHGPVMYSVGDYKDHKFAPGPWRRMDLGNPFYAPNCLQDDRGRRVMWGWVTGGGTKGKPWCSCLTLPRALTLWGDGQVASRPAPELQQLRGKHWHFDEIALTPESAGLLPGAKGDCLEIIAEFTPGDAEAFGLKVRCADDGKQQTLIFYDRAGKQLVSGPQKGSFELLDGEKTLKLQVFLDKSVVEVYVNDRQCMTSRIYPSPGSVGVDLFARGGSVKVQSVDVWEMGTIWD